MNVATIDVCICLWVNDDETSDLIHLTVHRHLMSYHHQNLYFFPWFHVFCTCLCLNWFAMLSLCTTFLLFCMDPKTLISDAFWILVVCFWLQLADLCGNSFIVNCTNKKIKLSIFSLFVYRLLLLPFFRK